MTGHMNVLIVGEEQTDRAFSLGLAALLGKDVYNFGELVRSNIMLN